MVTQDPTPVHTTITGINLFRSTITITKEEGMMTKRCVLQVEGNQHMDDEAHLEMYLVVSLAGMI